MIRQITLLAIGLVLTVGCLFAAGRKNAATDNFNETLVGTWQLVSTEERMADGSKLPYQDVGPNGKGYLMYSADGHMCAAGMNPDRPAWADVDNPTSAEKLRAIAGYFSYCGRYKIDTADHVIYHYPEVAMVPNLLGTAQKRPYTFAAGILTFSDKDTAPGVQSYSISWKKIN